MIGWILLGIIGFLFFFVYLPLSLKVIRPTVRGLIERWGKYNKFGKPGLNWIIPIAERLVYVNITEMMVDAGSQEIITKDSLNAEVDAQIYFKVKPDEENVKSSEYHVFDYQIQIVALARTTLRNIIGTMNLMEANSERGKINKSLYDQLTVETQNWGIEIVRTELKEINPPKGVQEAMNNVVVANNQKIAAVDFATATETKADGEKRAIIKQAEGKRQTLILQAEGERQAKITIAEGEAQAIKLVNEAANTYFVGNAQLLKQLQTVAEALATNSKIVIPTGQSLVNVVGDLAGITKK